MTHSLWLVLGGVGAGVAHLGQRDAEQRVKQRDGQVGGHHAGTRQLIAHLAQGLLHRLQLQGGEKNNGERVRD